MLTEQSLQLVVTCVFVPGGIAGLLYLIARVLPPSLRESVRSGGAVAAFAAVYVLLNGLPTWPMTGSMNGLWTAITITALWPTLEQFIDRRVWFKRYLGLAIVTLAILRPWVNQTWQLEDTAFHVTLIAFVATMAWWRLDRAYEKMHPATVALACVLIGIGTSFLMYMEGDFALSQLAASWCAILAVVMILSFWPVVKAGRELLPFAVLVGTGLWLAHAYFYQTSFENWFWMVLASLSFVIRSLFKRQSLKADVLLTGFAVGLPVAFGVLRALGRLDYVRLANGGP